MVLDAHLNELDFLGLLREVGTCVQVPLVQRQLVSVQGHRTFSDNRFNIGRKTRLVDRAALLLDRLNERSLEI